MFYSIFVVIAQFNHNHFRNELRHFNRMTKKVTDSSKKNAVIMGRLSYFGIPESKRPLLDRLNIVLTREPGKYEFPSDVIVCKSMNEALVKIQQPDLASTIENVWILGGNSVYEEAMNSDNCHRIYFTKIMATFDCDAFFPKMPDQFQRVPNDEDLTEEIQEENGIKYQYQIFEKLKL